MLAYIDPLLFPDRYQIYELTPGQFVYPIFKNASTTIEKASIRLLPYHEHKNLQTVDVYLRDPFDRYVSGVQTYLRFHPNLDRETALTLIDECLFLNNHFSLQFHWIVNLARFTDAWICFKHIDDLASVTDQVWHTLTRDQTLLDRFEQNQKLQFYLQLDKILYEEFVGKTASFRQVCQHIKRHHAFLYNEVIQRSQDLCNVLD